MLDQDRNIASIQEIREVYLTERGKRKERRDLFAKLFFTFRERWLGELSAIQLKVWLCLLLHTNVNGTCYPSLRTISKETQYKSIPDISKAISDLERLGLLAIQRRKIGQSNVYTVLSPRNELPDLAIDF